MALRHPDQPHAYGLDAPVCRALENCVNQIDK